MKNHKLAATSALVLVMSAGLSPRIGRGGQSDTAAPQRVAIYVADFELSTAPVAGPTEKDKLGKDLELRSRQVQDCFAETLVEMLRKHGYSSSRSQTLPANGILLEGVFAEADQKNRIRRALLGSGSRAVKFTLYVGAFDQKNMNEPLYKEAPMQEPDPNCGPVITLNAYIPMARYEIAKDAGEEDMRNICAQIAADVAALLQRNPASGGES
jgi:Domain of unknown function (DUF4410)